MDAIKIKSDSLYYHTHKSRLSQKAKEYRLINKEALKKRSQLYYIKNRAKIMVRSKQRYLDKRSGILVLNKKNKLAKRYRLTEGQFESMKIEQGNKCYICGCAFSNEQTKTKAFIDHDHKTGDIRRLLCRSCNLAIGFAKENRQILGCMIRYLDEFSLDKGETDADPETENKA